MAPTHPASLFLYGTLMPGHLRWPHIEPHATGHRLAAVPGRLYDTGEGWPAAVLDPAAPTLVPGVVVDVRPDRLDALLEELDEVEGTVDDLYRRVLVTTDAGETAWAWPYAQPITHLAPIDRWDHQPEA